MVVRSIMFIILKTFTYYFVTLQIQIFDSTAYRLYIKKDFQGYINMADTKGTSIIWRINNEKVQAIRQQEQEIFKMNSMLENLKHILKKWQFQYATSSNENKEAVTQSIISNLGNKHEDLIDNLGRSSQKVNKLKALSLA